MKLVRQSAKVLAVSEIEGLPFSYNDGEKLIEYAGRLCYKSEDKITVDSHKLFLENLKRNRHMSVFEHSWESRLYQFSHHLDALDILRRKFLNIYIANYEYIVTGNKRAFEEYEKTTVYQSSHTKALGVNKIACENERHDLISMTVHFITNRAVANELVRHRTASYCLSGDTILPAYRRLPRSSGKQWSLKQLFEYQSDPKRKGRIKLLRIRSIDKDNRIIPGQIKKIIDTGLQQTFKVTCKSGRIIYATMNHRFLLKEGWKALSSIKIGDKVLVNGLPALDNPEWLREKYLDENNTLEEMAILSGVCVSYVTRALRKYGIYKPLSQRKNMKPGRGVKGMHSPEGRALISQRMKGSKNHRWKGDDALPNSGRLRAHKIYTPDKCWGCSSKNKLERHHIDCNPLNNNKKNIMFLCHYCHKAFHFGQNVNTVFLDEIVSIESHKIEQTFDIEMLNDPHNFVANGFVVHNSQESTRYCNYNLGKFGSQCTFILPLWYDCEDVDLNDIATIYRCGVQGVDNWLTAMKTAEQQYNELIKTGQSAQSARGVLPLDTKTEIIMTANLMTWKHVINQRYFNVAGKAHRQIYGLMKRLLLELEYNTQTKWIADYLGNDEKN